MELSSIIAIGFVTAVVLLFLLFPILVVIKILSTLAANARDAALYRSGQSLTPPDTTGPAYTLVYKAGRKTEIIRIQAETEGEAMAWVLKHNIRFDKILSLTKG